MCTLSLRSRIDAHIAYAFSQTDHWEICKNPAAGANYCQKPESRVNPGLQFTVGEGDPREMAAKGERPSRDGSGPGRGARTDIAEMVKFIQSGGKDWEVMDKAPHLLVQYPRMPEQARAAMEAKRRDLGLDKATDKVSIRVVVLWGGSGAGKSHRARYWVDYLRAYRGLRWTASAPVLQNGAIWADNYTGEDVVLMEDFNPFNVDEETFLRLLDVWARPTASRKGKAAVTMRATWWFFTSNFNPEDWWPASSLEADGRFIRRVSWSEKMVNSSSPRVPEDTTDLGCWMLRQCSPLGPVDSTTPLLDPSLLLCGECTPTQATSPPAPVMAMTTSRARTTGAIGTSSAASAGTTSSTATAGSSLDAKHRIAKTMDNETPSMQYTPRRVARVPKRKRPAVPQASAIQRMASRLAWQQLEQQLMAIPPTKTPAPIRPRTSSDEAKEAQARNLWRQQQAEMQARKVRAAASARVVHNVDDDA